MKFSPSERRRRRLMVIENSRGEKVSDSSELECNAVFGYSLVRCIRIYFVIYRFETLKKFVSNR